MGRPPGSRVCRCGTRLARDNRGARCHACARAINDPLAGPPVVPPEFWEDEKLREALARWHIGQVIRVFRTHPFHGEPISQVTVARWINVTQTKLSRIENGPAETDLVKLTHWASVLGVPSDLLWFKLPSASSPPDVRPAGAVELRDAHELPDHDLDVPAHPLDRRAFLKASLGATVWSALNPEEQDHVAAALENPHLNLDSSVVTYFGRQLGSCMSDDGANGPSSALAAALGLLMTIEQSARDVRADVRRQLLCVAARGAEFVGWLYRDVHDPLRGGFWYDRATEWAQEAGDMPMQGYVLLKKSQMAYDERDAVRVLTLAQAAQNGPWRLPPRVKAEVTQQEARGLAMTGEPMHLVEQKLEVARRLLSDADVDASHDQLGAYYNDGTLVLRTASCYVEAGKPRQAAELYDHVLMADLLSRRDRGYFMARKASSLALAGEPDEAASVGVQAAELATATASQRTKRELGRTLTTLGPWSGRPGTRQLRDALAN
jgi:hypothetical protein